MTPTMPSASTRHTRTRHGLVLAVACLVAAAWWAVAQDSTPPVKIGGAIGVNWTYGSYGYGDNPHRRADKVGDAHLAFHNVIGRIEYR